MHGLEDYLVHADSHNLENFRKLKSVVMRGESIWNLRDLILNEIKAGYSHESNGFATAMLAHWIGEEHVTDRRLLNYIQHAIPDPFFKRIRDWSWCWDASVDINDHFSRGQINSKLWLVDELSTIIDNKRLGTVFLYGGWYATLGYFLFSNFEVDHLYNLEMDKECQMVANQFNHANADNFTTLVADVSSIQYDSDGTTSICDIDSLNPTVIVNTSCEHMSDDWFNNIPPGKFVVLQTNNYFENPQHSNCVASLEDAKKKYKLQDVIYEGSLDTHLYTRYMLIGIK